MTEPEKIAIYKKALSIRDEEDVDNIRNVSCKFYQDGGCPRVYSSHCKGCLDEDAVHACKTQYLSKIFDRPQEFWTPDFDAPLVREKSIKVAEVKSLGQKCDTCYASTHCQYFQVGASCSIDFGIENIDISDSKQVFDFLIQAQMERLGRLKAFEIADGGMVDQNMSSEMDRLTGLMSAKRNMNVMRINQSAEIPLGDDAKASGGILSKLFGGATEKEDTSNKQKTIDRQRTEYIDAEIVEEPVKAKRNES